jgi:hypothetical protein
MAISKRKWETTMQEDPSEFQRGKFQEDRRSKITRVNRLINLYRELSDIERRNFINYIQNYG